MNLKRNSKWVKSIQVIKWEVNFDCYRFVCHFFYYHTHIQITLYVKSRIDCFLQYEFSLIFSLINSNKLPWITIISQYYCVLNSLNRWMYGMNEKETDMQSIWIDNDYIIMFIQRKKSSSFNIINIVNKNVVIWRKEKLCVIDYNVSEKRGKN